MAPRRVQIVLAVEVAAPWRPTSRVVGNSPAGPPDEHRQSIVGNAAHGELLKLGIEIGQTSVAKYMARRRGPPSQGWKTSPSQSCRRHRGDGSVRRTDDLISLALWLVNHGVWSTTGLWFGVTAHPTAEWIANQITQACGWKRAPRYLIRDRTGPMAKSLFEGSIHGNS